jgi:hypothetical protein
MNQTGRSCQISIFDQTSIFDLRPGPGWHASEVLGQPGRQLIADFIASICCRLDFRGWLLPAEPEGIGSSGLTAGTVVLERSVAGFLPECRDGFK